MHGQYGYPPPGPLYGPPHAYPNALHPPANGAYPYPYPHLPQDIHGRPLYPPHLNPPIFHHYNGQVHQPPPYNRQAPNSTSAPQGPPGFPLPSPVSASSNPQSKIMTDNLDIDEHWRSRLAPLPGYSSRPLLREVTDPRAELLRMQHSDGLTETPISTTESHPPVSFSTPASQRTLSLSPKSPSASKSQKKKAKKQVEETKKDFYFDKYADIFVPQYLQDIQRETRLLQTLPALPVFPPVKYLQSFLVPRLIDEALKTNETHALLSLPPIPADPTADMHIFNAETYNKHWGDVLRWELDEMATRKSHIVLWKVGARVVLWKDAEFVLDVPGIRENHPYLEIGDLVHMREVLEPGWIGRKVALEGRVVALRKREGLVHISSDPLKEHIKTLIKLTPNIKTEDGFAVLAPEDTVPFKFNISFVMNARALCLMDDAVGSVEKILNDTSTSGDGANLAKQWIFPEPHHFFNAPSQKLEKEIKDKEWVDRGLNAEQRMAVKSVSMYQLPVPHLISGPPGTGKTRTVVESVLQILKLQPESCILLCAPSSPATDTLVLRLHKHLKQHEMLRLNDRNRTFAEVPDEIKPFCYVEDNGFSIPPWKKLMKYRVVVCSCLDAGILVSAQCTNTALMSMEEEITSTLHPFRKTRYVVQPHWTHLLIDEAAQGSEPELLIPISVVLPQVYTGKTVGKSFMPQLVLCGDINQLGPIVVSDEARKAELEISLLERLFERPLYKNFSSLDAPTYAKPGHTSTQRLPPYTHLVKNYRSHPAILMPPSAIFYNDSLEPCAKNGVVSWTGLLDPELPLKFIGDISAEESSDERASWFNPGQISAVVNVVKSLLADSRACTPPLKPSEIGVMAPWREQVWKLRERLRKESLGAVDVGTVEDYQGRENRVIIISCVRSNPRFLEEDHQKGLGLVLERKRMNVAITRAKELLVVIGNATLLSRDPYWKSFLQFSLRNKLYEGPELSLEMDGNYISRLESALILSRKGSSNLDAEEAGVVVAGTVAREVLRE